MLLATCVIPVKTHTIQKLKLYDLEDLHEDIQKRILEEERQKLYNDEFHGYFEREDFFQKAQEIFELYSCEIGVDSYDNVYIRSNSLNEDYLYMDFKRGIKYILSVIPLKAFSYSYKEKHKLLHKKLIENYNRHKLYSKVYNINVVTSVKHYEDYLYTGYYTDYCYLEAIQEFITDFNKSKNYNLNIKDFLKILVNHYQKEYNSLNDSLYSDEYIKEFITNEWYFDEKGNRVDYKIIKKECVK